VVNLGFDQTLNPATVNTTTVSLLQGGSTVVPTTLSLVGGGTIVQLTPNASLTANTSYTVQLTTGLLGTNGLPDGVDAPGTVLSFTTAAGADTMNPTVTLVSPPNGSVNVGDNANIRVRFSKAINPLSVSGSTITISGGSVTQMPYTVSFISTQEVLIVPYTPLPDATQMTLTISGVTDVAGNAVVAQTTQFTTGTGPDVTIPVVVSANPYSGESNVPLNATIQLQVNEPVDPGTVNSSTFTVRDSTTSQTVVGSYSVSVDGQTISFVPSVPLAVSRNYTVSFVFAFFGITDVAGNRMSATNSSLSNFSFTTGTTSNTTQPQVIGVSPANGLTGVRINAQVVIQFNEPVDALTVNQVTLSGGGTVNVTRTLTNGNQTLVLVPVVPLITSTSYTLTITGVQDIAGNSLGAPVTTGFTTGTVADLTPPTVLSVNPATSATGVLTTAVVQLQFSKRVDPLTVSNSTFFLFPSSTSQLIPGTITVSTNGLTATFTPAAPLAISTSYQLNATSGVTDLEGQPLVFFASSFTTGTQ